MEVLESWEKAEDEKIQELLEIRKKVRYYRQKEKEKAENTMINNKQFAYTLCSNIYKYLQTDQEQERKMHHVVLRNIFNCLKVKCSIYNVLENILYNMHDYEQEQKEDNNIDTLLYIENDFNTLKDKLITEYEKEQLKEIKDIAEREEEKGHNNDYINKLQGKYYRIIASVFFNIDNTTIRLIDGEEIYLKNNDRLIII